MSKERRRREGEEAGLFGTFVWSEALSEEDLGDEKE